MRLSHSIRATILMNETKQNETKQKKNEHQRISCIRQTTEKREENSALAKRRVEDRRKKNRTILMYPTNSFKRMKINKRFQL